MKVLPDDWFDPIYLAAVQAIDEAVVNAMLAAESMTTLKPAGLNCQSLEAQRLVALLGTDGA